MNEAKTYKVSVVTAVYNVEDYLEDMVESIIAQTIGFENIQLILVDDGSKDESWSICERYMEKYPDNVVAIHKENGGVSSARNEGLEHVQGEYVNFTDSDDLLEENALEKMYKFLKKYEEWIDVAAIKMMFFGGKEGEHPLNYRFEKTRMINLKKDYNYIQLSLCSALVKAECFQNRRFDTQLSYGEDSQLMLDILLDKMRYGIVCDTSYLYRKRISGTSAIDTGRKKFTYYITSMERFLLYSLKNALAKKGYIPRFIQFACMYDLQWRLKVNTLVAPEVLTEEEEERYKAMLIEALSYIDDRIINEQKSLTGNYKAAIMASKEENKGMKQIVVYPDDIKICIRDMEFTALATYTVYFEFLTISEREIRMEGFLRYAAELEGMEIYFKGKKKDKEVKFGVELSEREERQAFYMGELITEARHFSLCIDREECSDLLELQVCMLYQNREIKWKKYAFGKFFPLAEQFTDSYLYYDGLLLTHPGNNKLKFQKTTDKKKIEEQERKFQQQILELDDTKAEQALQIRRRYQKTKRSKKKEIWLISDREEKADDNGEAFFTYMNTAQKNSGIDTYFVLNKDSEDYGRLQKIGKVVPTLSDKHISLSLLCDKVISSQGEDHVFNPFYDMVYIFKDIMYSQKFVFLQHGVTKDDLSRWLRKRNKNISLFVTTTHSEYQSILEYEYEYDENQVKCTGFPRYDYLYDKAKESRLITFMPTWRSYLVNKSDVKSDRRNLETGFAESSYCQMYRQVFTDHRLHEAIEKYGYKIRMMLHPSMPEKCIKYLQLGDDVEILSKNSSYRELFAESSLIVTDYSSTVFDFAYLRKPVLYFQQDVEEFFSGRHSYDKGYFDYERDGFGEVEYTAEALVSRMIEYMEQDCQLKDMYRDRIEKTFAFNDKENCRRVYEEIRKL